MNEMANAQLMLNNARNFFKRSSKTDSKIFSMNYGPTSLEPKQKRLDDAEKASEGLSKLNQYHKIDAISLLCATPLDERVGNCNGYICAALKFGMAMEIPYIWLAVHECHMFLVLANESELKSTLALEEFDQYEKDDFWVCDPWFDIFCKLNMYGSMVLMQASRWTIAGKEICNDSFQVPPNQWCQRLFKGEMRFLRMTDSAGMATQDCSDFFASSD